MPEELPPVLQQEPPIQKPPSSANPPIADPPLENPPIADPLTAEVPKSISKITVIVIVALAALVLGVVIFLLNVYFGASKAKLEIIENQISSSSPTPIPSPVALTVIPSSQCRYEIVAGIMFPPISAWQLSVSQLKSDLDKDVCQNDLLIENNHNEDGSPNDLDNRCYIEIDRTDSIKTVAADETTAFGL